MNCNLIRKHLLGSEQPNRPPTPVADHLAECAPCREWHRQLVRMEQLVPHLPVARSSGKIDLVREVLHGPAYGPHRPGEPTEGWQRKERGLRKLAVAAALAAGLLICAFGIWLWRHHPEDDLATHTPRPPARETLADKLSRHDRHLKDRLDAAKTPGERIAVLADAADQLHRDARAKARAGKPADLAKLARLYDEVVRDGRDGLLAQAREIQDSQRADLLTPIAERLARAESEARTLAKELPEAAGPLGDIALVAQNGQERLKALIGSQA
jgi:hypothetical protein